MNDKELKRLAEIAKRKQRMWLVHLDCMRKFAEKRGIKGANKMRKRDLIPIFEQTLDKTTVQEYFEGMDEMGLCKCDLYELTGISKSKTDKLLETFDIQPDHILKNHKNGFRQLYYVYGWQEIMNIMEHIA